MPERMKSPKRSAIADQHLLEDADIVLAAPQTQVKVRETNVWALIIKARQMGKKVVVILPDGTQQNEWVRSARRVKVRVPERVYVQA